METTPCAACRAASIILALAAALSCASLGKASAGSADGSAVNMVVQLDYPKKIIDLSWAPGGDLFVTGNEDGEIKYWSSDGKLLKSVSAGTMVNSIAVSPDGKLMAHQQSADNDSELVIRTMGGDRVASIRSYPEPRGISWSPDGKFLICLQRFGIQMVDAKGRLIKTFSPPPGREFYRAGLYAGGTKLAAVVCSYRRDNRLYVDHQKEYGTLLCAVDGSSVKEIRNEAIYCTNGTDLYSLAADGTMRIHDGSGAPRETVRPGVRLAGIGNTGLLSRFPAFSPDGTRIAMARLDDRDFRPLGFICRRDGSIIHTLMPGKEMVASPHLSFSPDGKLLAWFGATDRLLVWNAEGGTIAASPRSEADTSIAFHRRVLWFADTVAGPEGKSAVEMRNRKVVRWDLASGAMDWRNHLVPPQGQEVFGLRGPWPSPGGDRIIYKFGTYAPGNIITESILMFDAKGDAVPVKPPFRREAENFGQYYHFSPDGSMVANLYRPTEFERHIKIWTRDGDLVRSIRLEDFPHGLAFSPDWTRIGMVYPDGTAVIRNIEGRVIRTFPTNRRNANQMFTPDFRSLVTVDNNFTVRVFSTEDGRKLREFSGGPRAADPRNFSVMDMDISPDGKKLLADSIIRSGTIGNPGRTWNYNLIDLETGRWKTINRGMEDEFSRVRMFFSPDGQGFASYALNLRHVNLWDREGNHVRKIEHLRANVRWAQYTPDGKYLLVSQRDGSHRLINLKTWEYIMFLEDEGEWIVYTADGYFDGSPGCGRLVAMVQGLRAFGVEQFALKFNRPDIILRRIGLGSRETIDHFYNQYLRRLRRMGLAEGDLSDELHVPVATIGNLKQDFGADRGRVAELRLHMKDTRHPLAAYQVYVNEVPVFGEAGKAVSGREALVTERVELANGRNKIEVSCRNRRGAESLRALAFAEYRTPAKGDLYFIGIGVSKYRDPSLDLKYAHKDALDLGKAFGRMGTMYDRVHVKTFLDAEVTAEKVRKSREFMKDAKVDDTAVLFVAGHGLHDTDRESTYYYLTHDADVNRLKETAADFDLLEDIFHGIAPRNRLLLMDTCESGESDEALADAPAAGSRGIRARTTRALSIAMKKKREGRQREFAAKKDRYIYNDLKRRTGAIVFSSSRGGELSYESDEYRNGLFTKEIIEGLSGKADADGDGKVSSDELRAHVARSVPKLSGGRQHPTVDRDNLFIKINLPKVR